MRDPSRVNPVGPYFFSIENFCNTPKDSNDSKADNDRDEDG